eukprot:TRINITY_DN2140_c0_g2_i1.p1 TRINITY_DN2140_c0_g2~~TRINITY_DN2140_c0_g2_i1.p1  ORF type:complete len:321 (-),score=77.14 TRINITY_DN2140_c0_g2_i1:120-1082(-)
MALALFRVCFTAILACNFCAASSDGALALVQLNVEPMPSGGVTLREENAFRDAYPFDEAGYQAIVELKNNGRMGKYIRKLLAAEGAGVTDEDSFKSFVPKFSGTKGSRSFAKLLSALENAPFVSRGGAALEALVRHRPKAAAPAQLAPVPADVATPSDAASKAAPVASAPTTVSEPILAAPARASTAESQPVSVGSPPTAVSDAESQAIQAAPAVASSAESQPASVVVGSAPTQASDATSQPVSGAASQLASFGSAPAAESGATSHPAPAEAGETSASNASVQLAQLDAAPVENAMADEILRIQAQLPEGNSDTVPRAMG